MRNDDSFYELVIRDLMKEHKRLTPIVEKYLEYKKAKADAEEARALLEEGGLDKDFREMVEAEYAENREKTERFAEELKICLLYTSRCV